MAIGGAIAAILAGLAAGAGHGAAKRKQQEEEFTRQIMTRAGFERASKGDLGFADNPDMVKALGKPGVQALQAYAQQIQQQNAQAEQADIQARGAFFPGGDPLAGMGMGKRGGTMAGVGGGPTVTGGPGGSVSVQELGTGRAIPAQGPAAAIAQAVGPAAGPPDEEQAQEPAAIPPTAPARPATPPSGLEQIQSGLQPGQSVSGKVGGVSFSVSGRDPNEKADALGRRIIAEGIKAKRRPDEMVVDVFAAGGKLPENFRSYSDKIGMDAIRENMRTIGADIKSMSLQQKLAVTSAAIDSGGSIPETWKSMVGITRDDEHALAGEVVLNALSQGIPFHKAREYAESKGLRLSKEDEVAIGQRVYGEAKTAIQTLEPDLAPEEVAKRAAHVVRNDPRFVPPDERAAIREPAPASPETRAREFERTGRVPRLSDTRAGTGPSLATSRQQTEQEAIGLAGQRAGTVKTAEEGVDVRLPVGVQEKINALNSSITSGQRIYNGYKPEYVGPAKARIDNLREKLIDKSLPPAESKFRSDLQDFLNVAIFNLTGKQVGSITEAERILMPLPNINLPPTAFEARLSALRQRLSDERKSEGTMSRSQRYHEPAEPVAPEAPPPATAPTISPEERALRKRLKIQRRSSMPVDARTLLSDPNLKALPPDRRNAILQDAGLLPKPASSAAGAVATGAGQFAQRANEGLIGALGFPFASKEFVDAYRQVAPPIPGAEESAAGRVGEFVGQTAGMAAPAFGLARTAQAIKNAYGIATEFGAPAALRVIDWIGKAMGNVGGAKTPMQVAGREARAAVGAGAGGVAATELFPDSKVAELGGQLIGALGPEIAISAIRRSIKSVASGVGPISREGATQHVGSEIAASVPPGSAAEAGLQEAVGLQKSTGLAAPVAQATQAPGMQALESRVMATAPGAAANVETRRAATSDVLRERVGATPGAAGSVPASQEAIGQGLAADRAAAQAPVAEAQAMREQAIHTFSRTASDVEAKMQAALAKAETEGDRLAASIRPTATAEEVGDQIQRQVIGPARQAMKTEADRLYALVDPDNAVMLPTDRIAAAVKQAKTEQGDSLIRSVPELDDLLAQVEARSAAPFNTVRRWASALSDASHEAMSGERPNARVSRLLAQTSEAVQKTLDDVVQTGAPDVAEKYAAAKSYFAEYADKFLSGVVAKVMQRGAQADTFKIAAEDVGKELFRSRAAKARVRTLDQYFDAVGDAPGAKAALADTALQDFFGVAYRSADGAMDPKAAMGWLRDHRGTLDELKRRGGADLVPELTTLIQQRQSVEGLRGIATAAQKRLAAGNLPEGGNPVAAATQHLGLAEAASKRTLAEIDASAAAKYVGADPALAGRTLLTGGNPTQAVQEVMSAARGDVAAERGIRRALLDQALGEARGSQAVATGNPIFDTAAFGSFLERNAGPLRAAFGDEGMDYLQAQHRIAQQILNPQAAHVTPGGIAKGMGMEALYAYQQLLGRAYQGNKGFASKSYLVAEAVARKVGQVFNQFSNDEMRTIYERSLYDPAFANDLRMMTFKGFVPEQVSQRLRAHLGPTVGTARDAATEMVGAPAGPQ